MPFFIYLGLCVLVSIAGRDRILGFPGFLLLSLLFTPIVGILVLVFGKQKAKARQ